ncbi:MAG TPA: nitroreductase family protein, partial [Acidimicrobiia bacterium]|nr:nitroreductase family protein [Acidimicrobiia bacterium]
MEIDVAMADHLLSTTRSVRRRLDLTGPVAKEVITECVRVAIQAPSAANAQNWRWVAVTEPQRRAAIAGIHRSANEEYAERRLDSLPDAADRRRMASSLHLIRHLHEVPVHVVVYALDPQLDRLDGQDVPPALLYGSVFPAVWSFQLALRARGLGTAPLHVADQAAVNQVVGAPPSARIASLLPVA